MGRAALEQGRLLAAVCRADSGRGDHRAFAFGVQAGNVSSIACGKLPRVLLQPNRRDRDCDRRCNSGREWKLGGTGDSYLPRLGGCAGEQGMSPAARTGAALEAAHFRIGFSADFCDDKGQLAFPDLGLALLEGYPGIAHEFLREYHAEYVPDQLAAYDVLISLKPKITAQSLEGNSRLCAIGRCGVG